MHERRPRSILRSTEEVPIGGSEFLSAEVRRREVGLCALNPGLLRLDHLLEERLLGLLCKYPVPGRELRVEYGFAGVDDLNIALPDLFEILRKSVVSRVEIVGRGSVSGIPKDRLEFRRERIEFPLVEEDLQAFGLLMVASHHVKLGDVREAEQQIRGRIAELGSIKHTAVHGGN